MLKVEMSFEMSDSLPVLFLDDTFLSDSPSVNAPAFPFAGTDAVDIQGQPGQLEAVSTSPVPLLPFAGTVEQFNSFSSPPASAQSVFSPSHEQLDTIKGVTAKVLIGKEEKTFVIRDAHLHEMASMDRLKLYL